MSRSVFRIGANYLRLMVGLAIGVLILRTVLPLGEGVFGVYAFLVFGLAFGQLVREATRIAVLPSMSAIFSDTDTPGPKIESVAAFINLASVASVFLHLLSAVLVGLYISHQEEASSAWWGLAVFARLLSSLYFVRVLDLQLYSVHHGNYLVFNIVIVSERVLELLAVFVASLFPYYDFFLIYSLVLGSLSLFFLFASQAYKKHKVPQLYIKFTCGVEEGLLFYQSNRDAVVSGCSLVLTNSIHYRLVIVVTGLLMEGPVSSAIAISSQLVGYIRQVVVGITSGLDTVLGAVSKRQGDGARNLMLKNQFVLTSIVVCVFSSAWLLFQPQIFALVGLGEMSPVYDLASLLFPLLVVSVVMRAGGEVFVSYLVSTGEAKKLSTVSICFSLLLPLAVLGGFFYIEQGADFIYLLAIVYIFVATSVYFCWLPYLCRTIVSPVVSVGVNSISVSLVYFSGLVH